MKNISHFNLPENTNKLYANEARSSISLTREVAEKINELVDAYNELARVDLAWKQEQDGRVRGAIVYMKDNLMNSLNDMIETLKATGFVDERIKAHINILIQRVDNLLGSVKEGSTTLDAELIDVRVDANGNVQANAGEQVRKIERLVNGIMTNSLNIYNALNWTTSQAINAGGNVYTAGSPNFKVAHIQLAEGTKVSYRLFSNSGLPVIASGDEYRPITIIDSAQSSDAVIGEYTVLNVSEVLWFSTTKVQDKEAYIRIELPKGKVLGWSKMYIDNNGEHISDNVYGTTNTIFVPKGNKITATLMASDAVCAISKCNGDGEFISCLRRGRNGAVANEYSYYATEDCFVRLCTRINGTPDTMKVTNVNIRVEDMGKFYVPTFNVGNGHINVIEENVKNDGVYMYSDLIYLDKGMTIHFYSSGSSAMYALSEWNSDREFVSGIVTGNTRHREIVYTAPKDMIVRISAKKVQSGTEAVTTEEEFKNVKIYFKEKYYADVQNDLFYGKSITFFGDSLAYGNIIGQDATWCHLLALKYNMVETNMGVNGNSVAHQTVETANLPMVVRVNDIPVSDYIVVIGGANDKRLNVPISDYKTALTTIVNKIRELSPRAKLLFLTNYNRFPNSANSLGLNDIDYVDAMKEVCQSMGVKCFDNYRESGVTFADWIDEGLALGTTANRHISREGYKWLLPIYENLLRGL